MAQDNVIGWTQDTHLTWPDFKAESNPSVFEDAHTVIKYRFTWTVNSERIDDKIMFLIEDIRIFTEFYPLLSWVRYAESDDKLLKHEQGIFDLAELVKQENTERLQKEFHHKYFQTRGQNQEQRKQFAKEDSGKMIAKQVEQIEELFKQRRITYQTKTNFGQNQVLQSEYDAIFERLRL